MRPPLEYFASIWNPSLAELGESPKACDKDGYGPWTLILRAEIKVFRSAHFILSTVTYLRSLRYLMGIIRWSLQLFVIPGHHMKIFKFHTRLNV